MLTADSPGFSARSRSYRFAGVELDSRQLQLKVDGRPVTCPPKSFELLVLLCRSPRTVLSRAELMDALWPGGQVVSDEALTQAIFRARAALGAYADLVTTVRGVGLRLDAAVTTPEVAKLIKTASEASSQPATSPASRRRATWPLLLVGVAAVLVAAMEMNWRGGSPDSEVLVPEYGLTVDAILAEQADTPSMIVEALNSDAIGERGRGVNLLEAVHRSDASTPIPALFLALWLQGQGQREVSRDWLEQAEARIGEHRELYLNLLYNYIAAELEGNPEEIVNTAGAVLDSRPDAWRMRHARAHLLEYSGMREAALREIAMIRVDSLKHRKLALVVADRASMGDVDGAQALLDPLSPDEEPAMFAFLNGRVAWSRGDFESARDHFVAAGSVAHEFARRDIVRQSLIYAGALEVTLGRDDQALVVLERARGMAVGHSPIDEIDTSLSIAQLHHSAGHDNKALVALDRALELSSGTVLGGVWLAARFTAMRLRPGAVLSRPDSLLPDADALWQAAELTALGQTDPARSALIEAVNRGVVESRLADEARWLQLALGLPVSPESLIDPPYPPLSRVVLRREIREALAERGENPGPQRP